MCINTCIHMYECTWCTCMIHVYHVYEYTCGVTNTSAFQISGGLSSLRLGALSLGLQLNMDINMPVRGHPLKMSILNSINLDIGNPTAILSMANIGFQKFQISNYGPEVVSSCFFLFFAAPKDRFLSTEPVITRIYPVFYTYQTRTLTVLGVKNETPGFKNP